MKIPPITRPTHDMNKTEALYADRLRDRFLLGEILDWKYEPIRLVMAKRTSYTPDFMVVFPNRIEFHEVKGFWRDDARVKIKVAASMFPWFQFVAVEWKKKQWKFEHF